MAITKEKKTEILTQLTELFKNSKSVVFSNYQGVNVKDFGDLRSKLREKEVTYKVAKRTLIKLAAEKAGFKDIPEEAMEGQVGIAFAQGDEIAAAKTLYEFSKNNDNIKLLGALMEGRTLSKEETLELAKIPGKEELLTRLVGALNSPISGFHGVLSSLLRNFVGVVSAYKDKVEKDAPAEDTPAPAVEAKPAEEAAPKTEAEPSAEDKEAPKAETAADDAPTTDEKTEEKAEDKPAPAVENAPKAEPEAAPAAEEGEKAEEKVEDKPAEDDVEPRADDKPEAEASTDDAPSAEPADESSDEKNTEK